MDLPHGCHFSVKLHHCTNHHDLDDDGLSVKLQYRAARQTRKHEAGCAWWEVRRLEKERWSGWGSSRSLPAMDHWKHSPSLSSSQLVPFSAMYATRPAIIPARAHNPVSHRARTPRRPRIQSKSGPARTSLLRGNLEPVLRRWA